MLAYQLFYNERVIANGEAFNTEALSYLDEHFKAHVTQAVEDCLHQQAKSPIKYLAHKILESKKNDGKSKVEVNAIEASTVMTSKSSIQVPEAPLANSSTGLCTDAANLLSSNLTITEESQSTPSVGREDGFVLRYPGGLRCDVEPASTIKTQTELLKDLAVMKIIGPSVYEIESIIGQMEAFAEPNPTTNEPTPTVIFIEPPAAPKDLVFLKGIPYFANLSEKLQYHRRRRTPDVPTPAKGQTFKEKSLELLQNSLGGDLQDIVSMAESLVNNQSVNSKIHVVVLPQIQRDYLERFDVIDRGFREVMHPELMESLQKGTRYGESVNMIKSPYLEAPPVIFISYDPNGAALTYSRILSSYFPYYESTQHAKMGQMREENIGLKRTFNKVHSIEYWKEVHLRRSQRDESREYRYKQLRRREKSFRNNSQTDSTMGTPRQKEPLSTRPPSPDSRATSVPLGETLRVDLRQQAFAARDKRRQAEDSIFLEVLRQQEEQAAMTIQAVYRGYAVRKLHRITTPSNVSAKAEWTSPLPKTIPALVRHCVDHITAVHGEIFGNYAANLPPEPRYVKLLKPVRRSIPSSFADDEEMSESETWAEELIFVPPRRYAEPIPHVNPLRKMLEYHRLAGCNYLMDAMQLQSQCCGLSVLQRRAYDMFKSVCLSLLHIVYAELYHRGCLSLDRMWFTSFVRGYHAEVLAWFSLPHLVSRTVLINDASRWSGGGNGEPLEADDERKATTEEVDEDIALESRSTKRFSVASQDDQRVYIYDESVLARERVLLLGARDSTIRFGDARSNNGNSDNFASTFRPISCQPVAPHVYVAPPAVKETDWVRMISNLEESLRSAENSHDLVTGVESRPATPKRVHWWTLCPHPTVYVEGWPFVLAPRRNQQAVSERPEFDEFVLRMDVSEPLSQSWEAKPTTVVPAMETDPRRTPLSLHSGSRLADVDVGTTVDSKVIAPASITAPILTSFLSADILREEKQLSELLQTKAQENGKLNFFSCKASEDEDLYGYATQNGLTYTSLMSKPSLCGCTLRKIEMDVSNSGSCEERESPELHSTSLPFSLAGGSKLIMSTAAIAAQSKMFGEREHITQEMLVWKYERHQEVDVHQPTPEGGSPRLTPPAADSAAQHNIPLEVRTLEETAAIVASRTDKDMVEVEHLRPWILPMSGEVWLQRYEAFLETCINQLKSRSYVVLSVEDESQGIFVVSAAMISFAIEQMNPEETSVVHHRKDSVAQRRSSCILPHETAPQLTFLDDFYGKLRDSLRNAGVSVDDSVMSVVDVLKELNSSYDILGNIVRCVDAAESTTDEKLCRSYILQAVRHSEHFCWLVLLQCFLNLPFNREALDRHEHSAFASFTSFARSSDIQTWIERIDPWSVQPSACPDMAHLRYSNGLRRWDSNDYICFGVS